MVSTVLLLVALLAFANGANDNCKGVATLVGFGAATPRRALLCAALSTAIGAGVSFWLAGGLVKSFSTGLFAGGTPPGDGFCAAVLAGAVGWIFFATFTGLPVSTTHAITGGLVGAGLVAFSADRVRWGELATRFATPLALSPLLSLAVVYAASWPVVAVARRYAGRCVCVVDDVAVAGASGAAAATLPVPVVVAGTEARCAERSPSVAVSTASTANALHWASSGLVGFARGWNDAPKIAALAVATLAGAGAANGTAISFQQL